MLVIVKLEGSVYDVEELCEVPSIGEVVCVADEDFVVAGLRLAASPLNSSGFPVLNLLPIAPC
jgi:hypothetical protein